MKKSAAAVGSGVFFIIAPGVVAGAVPWWISRWRLNQPFFGIHLFRACGVLLLTAGILGLLDSFVRFAKEGFGTPAPVLPTRSLVVTGLYRYIRNPMYAAVLFVIIGQALLLGNVKLLGYGALVWLLFHLFVRLYEEPALESSFKADYAAYRAHVPRWFPRLKPWNSDHGT